MKQIVEKEKCTGCGVCVAVCPKEAITMKMDKSGFYYPVIDNDVCIECGKCQRSCHCCIKRTKDNVYDKNKYYAVAAKTDKDLMSVSSGGVFFKIAEQFIVNGNIVYGAMQEGVGEVTHVRADSIESVKKLRRSKYLQSKTTDIWKQVQQDLETGKKVLFSGVGCQTAALYAFLGKDYPNLYTCEVICHGVPSYSVFEEYLKETKEGLGKEVQEICFRDKRLGWKNNQISMKTDGGKDIVCASGIHPFHKGYLKGYYSRECCANCQYANLERNADIVLADFWKYAGEKLGAYKKKGISLVCCRTNKADELLRKIENQVMQEEVGEEEAIKSCRHLTHTPKQRKRKLFFELYEKSGFFIAQWLCEKPRAVQKLFLHIVENQVYRRAIQKKLARKQIGVSMKIQSKYRKRLEDFVKKYK